MALLSASVKSFSLAVVEMSFCQGQGRSICDISAFVYNQNYALFNHFSQKIVNDVISSNPSLCQSGDLDPDK